VYDVRVTVSGAPLNLALGTSPLVLYPTIADQAFIAIKPFGTNVVISYNGTLEVAPSVLGPWQPVPGAASPITLPISDAPAQFLDL
jgi:hypothetical protein